jgi:hypothetical protein
MGYLQRLIDSAAASAAVTPAGAAPSPIVAADQRLAEFPGLLDPFLPDSAAPDRPQAAAPAPQAPVPPLRQPAAPAVQPIPPVASVPSSPREADAPEPRPVPPRPAPESASPPVHPLQRLVEADPLPPPAPRRSARPAPQPAPAAEAAPRDTSALLPPPAPPPSGRSAPDAPAAPPLRSARVPAAWPIDATAFRPADAPQPATVAPEPRPRPAASAATPPAESPSPLAGPVMAPAAGAPRLQPPAPEREVVERVERIIERVREVPAPAPPRPMTAAEMSVIGPLGGRASILGAGPGPVERGAGMGG